MEFYCTSLDRSYGSRYEITVDSDNGLNLGVNVLRQGLIKCTILNMTGPAINRAYLHIIHMLRKWQFSCLLFMINIIFCKLYLLSS